MPVISLLRKMTFGVLGAVVLLFGLSQTARADSFLVVGNSNPNATAILNIISLTNGQIVFSVTNNSSLALGGIVTGVGFDLHPGAVHPGGFAEVSQAGGIGTYTFCDGVGGCGGNVPQFNSAVLDFAELTHDGNFAGGNPPSGTAQGLTTPVFTVSGNFTGFTQQQIANGVYIRFQSINCPSETDGTAADTPCADSDVGHGSTTVVPEPASMVLLGTGLIGIAAALRRARKKSK